MLQSTGLVLKRTLRGIRKRGERADSNFLLKNSTEPSLATHQFHCLTSEFPQPNRSKTPPFSTSEMSAPVECKCFAAMTAKGPIVPWTITRRACSPTDVQIDIKYAGICHSVSSILLSSYQLWRSHLLRFIDTRTFTLPERSGALPSSPWFPATRSSAM